MKPLFWTFFVLLLLSSCASQKRCFDKYGGIEIIKVRDTVYVPKEVVKFSFKTLIDTLEVVDTFYIKQGRASAIFTRDTVTIQCDADTVYFETIVKVPSIAPKKDNFYNHKEFWVLFGVLVLIVIVLIKK